MHCVRIYAYACLSLIINKYADCENIRCAGQCCNRTISMKVDGAEPSSPDILVFVSLRNALKRRCWPARRGAFAHDGHLGQHGQWHMDAFDVLVETATGDKLKAWNSATKNWEGRGLLAMKSKSGTSGDVLQCSCLNDAYRESRVAGGDSPYTPNAGTTFQLVQDPNFPAAATGALYRFPDRIGSKDFLKGVRRITKPETNALLPGAHALTVGAVNEFMARWDSASFLHAVEGSMHALDFLTYMRFASCGTSVVKHITVPTNPDRPVEIVRLGPRQSVSTRVQHATGQEGSAGCEEMCKAARQAMHHRETDILINALRQEYASWLAHNPSAAGGIEYDLSFRAELFFGQQSIMGQLTPAPSIALCLAAVNRTLTEYVSPMEARLALAQCGLFLTARETFMIGHALENSSGSSSAMSKRWAIADILELFHASALPDSVDRTDVVSRCLDAAKNAVSNYLEDGEAGFDNRELLRFLLRPSKEVLAAIQDVVDACLVRYRRIVRFCRSLGDVYDDCRGTDAMSVSSFTYAVKLAGRYPSSFLRHERTNTLVGLFHAHITPSARSRSPEKHLYWRELLRRCTPLHAMLAWEKSHDMSGGGVDVGEPKFDQDPEAVCASFASWMHGDGIVALHREFRERDTEKTGALTVDAFMAAAIAAGHGPGLFSAEHMRWVLAACHHRTQESCVSYTKYLAIILVGMERSII